MGAVFVGLGAVVGGFFGLGRAAVAPLTLRTTSTRWNQPERPVEWNLQVMENQIDLAVGAVLLGLGGPHCCHRANGGSTPGRMPSSHRRTPRASRFRRITDGDVDK